MKYIKMNLSFGDKLKLLFFGIVPEEKLPTVEVVKEVQVEKIIEKPAQGVASSQKEVINIKDKEEFHVPFFDLNNDDVNSNF